MEIINNEKSGNLNTLKKVFFWVVNVLLAAIGFTLIGVIIYYIFRMTIDVGSDLPIFTFLGLFTAAYFAAVLSTKRVDTKKVGEPDEGRKKEIFYLLKDSTEILLWIILGYFIISVLVVILSILLDFNDTIGAVGVSMFFADVLLIGTLAISKGIIYPVLSYQDSYMDFEDTLSWVKWGFLNLNPKWRYQPPKKNSL